MPRKKPETADATRPVAEQQTFEFQFRDHDDTHKRVWHTLWENTDIFEIIDNDSFKRLTLWCKKFSIPMVDKNGD